jgi:uncharacterized protein with GYD domain
MAYYLLQGNYAAASIKAMIGEPQDRGVQAKSLITSLGGTLHHFFFSFGETDFVILCELPDETAAMSVSMAVGATGAVMNYKTTKLISASDAQAAMRKAQSAKYSTPGLVMKA